MEPSTASREIRSSTIYNSVALIIRALVGAILSIILAKYLSVGDYGYIIIIFSLINISVSFSDLGISVASSRFITRSLANNLKVKETLTASILLRSIFSIIIFMLVFIFSSFIADNILKLPMLSAYIKIISFGILFASYNYFFGRVLQGLHKPSYNSIAIIVDSIAYSSLSIVLILLFRQGVSGIIFGFNTGKILAFIVLILLFIYRCKKLKLTLSFNKKIKTIMVSIAKYSFPLTATTLLAVLFTQIPIILIGRYLAQESAAIYGIPSRLIFILLLPSEALIYSASSFLAHYKEKSIIDVSKRLVKIYTIAISFYLPLFIFFIILSPEILKSFIVFIIKKEEYINSIPILTVLSLLLITGSIHRITGATLAYIGHPVIEAISNVFAAVILFIAAPIALIHYKLIGMAYVVVITSAFNALFMFLYLFRKYNLFKYFNYRKLVRILLTNIVFILILITAKLFFSNIIMLIIGFLLLCITIIFLNYRNLIRFKKK